MIDYMAEDGIVGPYNGKVREVIMTPEAWAAKQAGGDEADLIAELSGNDHSASPSPAPAPTSTSQHNQSQPAKPKLKLEPTETEQEPSDSPPPRRKSGPIRLVDPSELNDKGKTITVTSDNKVAPVVPAEPETEVTNDLEEAQEDEELYDDEEYDPEAVEDSADDSEEFHEEEVEYEEYEEEDVEWEDAD